MTRLQPGQVEGNQAPGGSFRQSIVKGILSMIRALPLLAAALLLPACGNSNAQELNEAANQSDPAAAEVLTDEANAIENGAEPRNTQDVLEAAANAQLDEPTTPEGNNGTVPPPG